MKENKIKSYMESNNLKIENIITRYTKFVYIYIKNTSHILSNEDIEEIVSDVFFIVWNNRNQLNIESPIEPYLLGISKNLLKNKYRKLHINDNIEDYENIISDSINMYEFIEQKEKNKIINDALNSMQETDREIFLLYYYYFNSIKDISTKLKLTETNIKTKLHRIRKKIRKFLIEGGYSYD